MRFEGITLLDGRIMREIDEEGYKCLGIIEVDEIKEKEITKKTFCKRLQKKAETSDGVKIEWKE